MVTVLPAHPNFGHPTEKEVLDLLVEQLPADSLVVVGQRLSTRTTEREVDLLAAIPGHGLVAIEVKAGQVWVDDDGQWRQGHGSGHEIDPVNQVRDAMYELRNYVQADPAWAIGPQRWTWLLVLPHTRVPQDFQAPNCKRFRIVDRTQLDELGEICCSVALHTGPGHLPPLRADGPDRLRRALAGRSRPQRDQVARAAGNEAQADALTREQSVLLRAVDALPRVEIRGGAGSGKTFLALEQARRLTHQGLRVALICYSHGLAEYLRRVTAGWPDGERPAYVGEFHQLGIDWGAPGGPDEQTRTADSQHWWEAELPRLMAELAEDLPESERFDAVVVDEAQDFADSWWRPVIGALRDREHGRLLIVGDAGQRVFQRTGRPPVDLVPLVLDHNLRNTQQIAAEFLPLAGERMELRGGSGPEVRYVSLDDGRDPIEAGDAEVEALLEQGWEPKDIALLTTGRRHPVQVELQRDGHEAYWDTFWTGDDIFFGHVLGFKGLERRCVVLVCNHHAGVDRLRERLYVGMSRATDVLVVVGDAACDET